MYCLTFGCSNDEQHQSFDGNESFLSDEERIDSCVQFKLRAYECREDLVDELIDFRAESRPSLAEAIRTQEGREEMRNLALAEFESEGADNVEKLSQFCSQVLSSTPRTQTDYESMESCHANESCESWTNCVMPVIRGSQRP